MRATRVLLAAVVAGALLAGCSSGPTPDAATQQACEQLARLTKQLKTGGAKADVKAAVQHIVQTAQGSTNTDITQAAQNLASVASQGAASVRTAADTFIKACSSAGVKRPGS
jgi:hypothetical protein